MMGKQLKFLPAFLLGLLCGGVVVGLALRSDERGGETGGEEVIPRVVERQPSSTPEKTLVSSAELTDLESSSGRKSKVEGMNDAELHGTIEAILRDADPFKGFNYKQKSILRDILAEMADRDFDGALNWMDANLSGAMRAYGYEQVLEKHFGEDKPRETLDLYESRGFEPDRVASLAGSLLLSAKELNNEDAVYLMQKSFREGRSSSGSHFKVADGFDYAAFAEAAIQLKLQDEKHKMGFTHFPTNLFEDWTKEDPHGAMEFYNKYYLADDAVELSFNGIEDLAKGYLATASHQDALAWTTEIIANPEIRLSERSELISFLTDPDNRSLHLLNEVGSAITDRDQAVEFSELALRSSLGQTNPSISEALALFPDGESRLANLEKMAQSRYRAEKLRERSAHLFEDLAGLGHSDAEIQRIAAALEQGK
ncbi:hypothetical protein [Haloferula sp.]|uniref:hypothetical protein n=1 Tax=Haloferula sp. TaxID=2497595 RepID=UPI0032A13EE5